ncbi:MAG: carotenoid biosynthesis protein, partial [Blastocatellia bacterium]
MLNFFRLLAGTVYMRPYVVIFLLVYLFLAVTYMGWRRTLIFTGLAYVLAFLCEWSSAVAGTGFPFGLYRYINQTSDRELWIGGVPLFDSLSFAFLSYVSWEVAILILGRGYSVLNGESGLDRTRTRRRWSVTLLASLLMMYLDIVIDPVALQGHRWFLGKLYEYPNGGSYFGVTITNFIGWFFLCFAIIRLFLLVEMLLYGDGRGARIPVGVIDYPFKPMGPVLLYFGIMVFNIIMTFRIGEGTMGYAGIFMALPVAAMIAIGLRRPQGG